MDAIEKAKEKTKKHLKEVQSNIFTPEDHINNLKNIIKWLSEKNKNQTS